MVTAIAHAPVGLGKINGGGNVIGFVDLPYQS
jgi:hypothetical protein